MMNVTETLNSGLRRAYSVVVPASDLSTRRDRRLAELGRDLKLPGFRPGKVPASVVRKRFGPAVQAEILEQSLNEATEKLIGERGLRPAMQPKVELDGDPQALGESSDLAFRVEMELLPEIAIPSLGAITLTRLVARPDDATIDKALADIRTRNRKLEDVAEERPAATGDVLMTDFVGTIDGVAFEGGTASDVPVEIGGTGFIPGFSEQLEGLEPGQTRTIQVTFPADYQAAELAGKEAAFEVVAKGLRRGVLPELDDAFAKTLGFDDLAKIRDVVREQMAREYGEMSRLRIKRELLDALAETVDFEAPAGMVEAEFAQIWGRIEQDRAAGRLDEEDRAKDEETLRADYRAIAERRVKLGLLLAEIGRANSIEVAQEEMVRAMRQEAGRYPGQEQQVLDFFRSNPRAVESLRGPIYENKVVDYVLELATVEEREVTAEELAREVADEAADADEAA